MKYCKISEFWLNVDNGDSIGKKSLKKDIRHNHNV